MRLGCEGESAIQPQFFVDTKELTIAWWGMVFKLVPGFRPATRTIHVITLSCMTISGSCISWIGLSPKSKDD